MKTIAEKKKLVIDKIIARRKELHISQWDLAIKLNLSENAYFKVEKGETKLDTGRLFLIFEILQISTSNFFKGFD